jgi:hypothetical protein
LILVVSLFALYLIFFVPSFFSGPAGFVVCLLSLNLLSGVPSFLRATFVFVVSAAVLTVLVWLAAIA